MGPLTGPAKGYGISQRDGVALAAGEINAHSRETGLRVELVVVDDEADMSAAGDRLVDLIYTHEVNAIIGAINSAVTHVVQMVAAKTHVPMITTTSTDPSITRAGSYYTFRCLPDDLLQGRALADRLFRIDGRRHVALLRQDNRYGKMGGSEIARIAKAKGRPLMSDAFFDGKAERFDREVDALRRAGPDALVIWGLYKPAGLLVKALRDAGLSFPVYGADGMAHPGFLEHAKDAADGVVMTFPFDPCRDDPVTRAFLERFRERFGYEADSFAAHSYDAMMIIWSAIRQGRCTDRDCIKDLMLKTRNHHGVTGVITLDKDGNDTREVELAVVRNGRFVPERADRRATGTPGPPGSTSTAGPPSSGWVSCPAPHGTP